MNPRIIPINVEDAANQIQYNEKNLKYRLWSHLGILFVGTVADQEGWEVVLYDELVEGYINLENVVRPGDVIGLSLTVTSILRGVELARQAKCLGARYCIAGNDAAIFRPDQILGLKYNPIDAVFTSNSLAPIRSFLRATRSDDADILKLNIPGIAVVPQGVDPSNERTFIQAQNEMRTQLRRERRFDSQDVFVVPNFKLFADEYWQSVWKNYRTVFGRKHKNPTEVRNATAMFAQGCTRTGTSDVCSYCTIGGVADIRVPTTEYLEKIIETYRSFGINYVFNVTDSLFEMRGVLCMLKKIGAYFSEGLMMYGRAYGIANHPYLIDEWLSLTGGRLLLNVGMDAGDERILSHGVIKGSRNGSRLDENRQAIRNIATHGAHLHYSLIFGSPGETRESCESSLAFFEWSQKTLGAQLDQCESDIYWLNHGSPASRVFRSYEYAQELAALAGKAISRKTWDGRFHRHRNTLVVPWECEEAWYDCFTSITIEEAQEYNARITAEMERHEGAAPGRAFWPR